MVCLCVCMCVRVCVCVCVWRELLAPPVPLVSIALVIKRPRFQNDDILIANYTNINTSDIIPCTVEQKVTTISEILTEAAMHDCVNIVAVISHLSNVR